MKVVITGGEGFIGRALAATLFSRGIEVIIVDRKRGIEAKDFFDTAANLHEADCVFHLAAQTSVFNTDKQQIPPD
ncbi:MAG: NAD(P)-dependent oxidoreductase [Bacteroides sp.]|nr:NAD(P)-dependent oxidoreductase [Bacteroides sp.]